MGPDAIMSQLQGLTEPAQPTAVCGWYLQDVCALHFLTWRFSAGMHAFCLWLHCCTSGMLMLVSSVIDLCAGCVCICFELGLVL